MAVRDLYSYRKRVAEANEQDVYNYDALPSRLVEQIIRIWDDAIGTSKARVSWETIHDDVAREHGVAELSPKPDGRGRCVEYLRSTAWVDGALDLIEVGFEHIDSTLRDESEVIRASRRIKMSADEAIAELNERFRRAGIGYGYENGMIVRIDDELIHAEVTKPALRFLNQPGFEGPRQEFMSAHAHYRAGETKDSITDANNAFESTLKTICELRGWDYPVRATASRLVKVVTDNGLLPDHLSKSFEQLAATLKSGLAPVRGEDGAHGQGPKPRETPDHVAGYALHLAAAKIVFLVEAHNAMNS